MSGVIDATKWMSEHMDDKSDRTPLPSGRPSKPDYLIQAERKEQEAWKVYLQVINEELESEKGNPDFIRLHLARTQWLQLEAEQSEAQDKWRKEQKEQK